VSGSDQIRQLSTTLFADYLLPFEVASVILLVALVGAIVLARKEPG
jgi:NADH-quinone oxidoreductase subunit J